MAAAVARALSLIVEKVVELLGTIRPENGYFNEIIPDDVWRYHRADNPDEFPQPSEGRRGSFHVYTGRERKDNAGSHQPQNWDAVGEVIVMGFTARDEESAKRDDERIADLAADMEKVLCAHDWQQTHGADFQAIEIVPLGLEDEEAPEEGFRAALTFNYFLNLTTPTTVVS